MKTGQDRLVLAGLATNPGSWGVAVQVVEIKPLAVRKKILPNCLGYRFILPNCLGYRFQPLLLFLSCQSSGKGARVGFVHSNPVNTVVLIPMLLSKNLESALSVIHAVLSVLYPSAVYVNQVPKQLRFA